jgi:uncharacterized protein
MSHFRQVLASLVAGLLFGAGLALSGMINPDRVLAFLDVFGYWNPALAFVLFGAVSVSASSYWIAGRRARPLFAPAFDIPRNSHIDARLVGGSAIFGVGWGLAGFCPGPALASLALGLPGSFVFVATMLLGMVLARIVPGASARRDLKTEVGYGHPA